MGDPEKSIDAMTQEEIETVLKRVVDPTATEYVLAIFKHLFAAQRFVGCVWCGATVMKPEEYPKGDEDFAAIVEACRQHDMQCPKNPLLQKLRRYKIIE